MVIGREAERAAVAALLEDRGERARALLLEGEPGIGKSTIWTWAVAETTRRGAVVLTTRPAERESALPFAALADLVDSLPENALADLDDEQQEALRSALAGRDEDRATPSLPVVRAALALVRGLANRPVVVAVDDAQWLDGQTARVLEYVFRRIDDVPVRVLVARRSDAAGDLPLGLGRALPPASVSRLEVGPLRATDLDALIRTRLDLHLPRPALVRLERITGGNPYYALEIARSLGGDGRSLAVPPSLGHALAERVASLDARTRDTLLLAAASVQPTADAVTRVAGGEEGLAAAVRLALLEVERGRIRFTHPLLATVAYERALPGERRDAHRRLAATAADAQERALHLARGAESEDAAVAAELEAAAGAAGRRGATEVAAELAEAAARLTPAANGEGRRRRLAAAAEHHIAAGDPARGGEILRELVSGLPPGPERAALLWRLADTVGDSIAEPVRLCEQALVEARGEPALLADIHTALGVFTWIAGELERATEHCVLAARFAEEAGDDERIAVAIGEACHAQAVLGVPWDRAAMERALALEPLLDGVPAAMRPSFQLGAISLFTDELDVARRLLAAELERGRRLGDEPAVFHALFRLGETELRAGNWADALAAARESVALARQAGIEQEVATTEMGLAHVLAHLGALEEARELAVSAYEVARAGGDRAVAIRSAGVLGFAELSAGEAEGALEWLTPARKELQELGTGELSIAVVVQNEIEALVATARLDEAEAVVSFVEEKGRPTGRAWHRAVAGRGRALVASARGDESAARAALSDALRAHEELPQPFELARTLLAAGTIERRARRWAAARERLTAALELLDGLGAARWAEHAAAELARLPGRRPRGSGLSETERQIAELAASGLANKQIAARLFVTVRTVEANLSRVYAKLGVRSRTELARTLST